MMRRTALLAVCLAVLLPRAVQAVPPIQFSPATNYPVAGIPRGIACADLNHDGKPDLVTANQSGNSVSVLFGLGGGAFQSPTNYTVAANPVFVAVGTFRTNGPPDIVTASYSPAGVVSVLPGNGDGTFAPATNWPAGDRPDGIAIADFNLDHNPDIAVVNTITSTVLVLLGDGRGAFAVPLTNSVPGGSLDGIVAGDFNGDGRPDLAVTSAGTGNISVLLGNGDGTFGAVSNYPATSFTASAENLQGLAGGDFNHDGLTDFVTANLVTDSSTFLKGRGDGSFLTVATNNVGHPATSVAVGDFNGDGNLDFVTANSASSLTLRLGNGDGTFGTNIFLTVGSSQYSVAVADVNGDGKPDILTANGPANTVSVFLNQSIPALKLVPTGGQLRISWPDWTGCQLETSSNLALPWSPVTNVPASVNGQIILTNPIAGNQQFYHLKHL